MSKVLDIEVIAKAILRNETSINFKGLFIDLPSPQTAGTETQKLVYARLKAKEVLKEVN
tara:strand:- start:2498 stop:2674 length:177 start_codon:yes stop_codon:yes gene_type:complete